MKKLLRIIAITLIVLVIIPAVPCFAIADPDTMVISNIEAWQTADGDQLYVVEFTLDYTSNPTEDAGDAFLIRLMDGSDEIVATAPYPYYNGGYEYGIVSFYFTSVDPLLPTWEDNGIRAQIIGNPSLTWDGGDPPDSTKNKVDTWTNGINLLPAYIRYVAQDLEDAYGVDMVEMLNGSLKLTAYGEAYMETTIPNLRTLAPTVFATYVTSPDYTSDNHSGAGKTALEARLTGTPFDQSTTSTELGISIMWITTMIWLIFSGIVIYAYGRYIGTVGITWVAAICMEVGAFGGWLPTEVAIGLGIVGGLLVIYPLFFRGAAV